MASSIQALKGSCTSHCSAMRVAKIPAQGYLTTLGNNNTAVLPNRASQLAKWGREGFRNISCLGKFVCIYHIHSSFNLHI